METVFTPWASLGGGVLIGLAATLLMLFLVSQVLIIARLKSNGLLMPVILHIAMNGTVIALQMGAQTLQHG